MTRPVVVITGAAGNVGGKLRAHLEHQPCDLRLIDIAPGDDPEIARADLATLDAGWTHMFRGADVVVHAAGQRSPEADWSAVAGPNISGLMNVYAAAQLAGVRRVVTLSSVWAVNGLRHCNGPLRASDADPGDSPYGATKIMGERVGRAFWDAYGIEGTAIRLGGCLPGANANNLSDAEWERDCWISNTDMLDGLQRAIFSTYTGFHVINLTSANPGSRWTLDEARSVLGYNPVLQPLRAPKPKPAPPPSPLLQFRWRLGRWVRGRA